MQGFIEGENHNPVGMLRTIWRDLEFGKGKLTATLFLLVILC